MSITVQTYASLNHGFKSFVVESWENICDSIRNPSRKYVSKDSIPLWTFYIPKNIDELKYSNINGVVLPSAGSHNMRQIAAFLVDVDGTYSIDDFVDKYKHLEFYLYTTWSHIEKGERYRVIFPLDGLYGVELFKAVENRELMCDFFPFADETCFQTNHRHYMPAVNPKYSNEYRYVINKGKKLELPFVEMVKNYNIHIKGIDDRKTSISLDNEPMLDDWYYEIDGLSVPKPLDFKKLKLDRCNDELSKLSWGNRGTGVVHSTICRVYGKLTNAGFDRWEAVSIIKQHAPSSAYAEINALARMK